MNVSKGLNLLTILCSQIDFRTSGILGPFVVASLGTHRTFPVGCKVLIKFDRGLPHNQFCEIRVHLKVESSLWKQCCLRFILRIKGYEFWEIWIPSNLDNALFRLIYIHRVPPLMSFLLGCDRRQKTKPKIILAKFYPSLSLGRIRFQRFA